MLKFVACQCVTVIWKCVFWFPWGISDLCLWWWWGMMWRMLRRVISLAIVIGSTDLIGDNMCRSLRGRTWWNQHMLLIRTTTDRKVQDLKQKVESPQRSLVTSNPDIWVPFSLLPIPLSPLCAFMSLHHYSDPSQRPSPSHNQVGNPWTVRRG